MVLASGRERTFKRNVELLIPDFILPSTSISSYLRKRTNRQYYYYLPHFHFQSLIGSHSETCHQPLLQGKLGIDCQTRSMCRVLVKVHVFSCGCRKRERTERFHECSSDRCNKQHPVVHVQTIRHDSRCPECRAAAQRAPRRPPPGFAPGQSNAWGWT